MKVFTSKNIPNLNSVFSTLAQPNTKCVSVCTKSENTAVERRNHNDSKPDCLRQTQRGK